MKTIAAILCGFMAFSGIESAFAAENIESTTNNEITYIESLKSDRIDLDDFIIAESSKQVKGNTAVSLNIGAGAAYRSSTAISLKAGDAVTINFVYLPSSSNVDFGVVSVDGIFYYVTTSGGEINYTMDIEYAGQYYLAVRNSSTNAVTIEGAFSY